jgi:hypothetical protein
MTELERTQRTLKDAIERGWSQREIRILKDEIERLTPKVLAICSTEVWRYNIILDESFQTQYNGLLKDVQRSEAEIKKLN